MKNTANLPQTNDNAYELRLITKGVAFLAIITGVLYLRVVVAEGLVGLRAGALPLQVIFLFAFLMIGVLGLLVAWRWEGIGGLLALMGGIGLAAIGYGIYGRSRWLAALLYSSPFIISGSLCLACWWQRRPKST